MWSDDGGLIFSVRSVDEIKKARRLQLFREQFLAIIEGIRKNSNSSNSSRSSVRLNDSSSTLQHRLDLLPFGPQFGEHITHLLREDVDEFVEERLLELKRAAILHRAAQDAAQRVVAITVAGLDAVGDGEAQGAQVVGDHTKSDIDLFLLGHGDDVGPAHSLSAACSDTSCRSAS